MNHLAHVVLAGPDPDHRLGAFLGDHVKGIAAVDTLSPGLARGVRLHRRIDTWSDNHPAVIDLRARTGPYWRRYSGVILDVLFDAMLTRHWSDYQTTPLDDFSSGINQLLARRWRELPPRLTRFAHWAKVVDLWTRYDEREMLDEIFARLAHRHGRPGPLKEGTLLLDRLEPEIDRTFRVLFPWLQRRAADFLASPDNA